MDTNSTPVTRMQGLEYDGVLRLYKENAQGAKIYRDFIHRFVVKVEDHASEFEPSPRVNFQGDHYMSEKGVMYLLIDDPESVDILGKPVAWKFFSIEEGPPPVDLTQYQLRFDS